ncbi:MAG: hypothetical protein ACFFB2_04755 [Promethearchaeota archaeon]
MQEYDIIRGMLYGCCMMISLVTTAKQFRLEGIFGTSNKIISLGAFFISCGLLSQTIISILNYQDPIWNPLVQLVFLVLISIGFGFVFFGLWKISVFFDELKTKAKKPASPVKLDDAPK